MSQELILTNARMVLSTSVLLGSMVVQGGKIAEIDDRPSGARGAIDLEGDLLIPGLVELHTDNLERQFMPRPGVRWPAAAALLAHDAQIAAAGITTVCDAVCVGFYGHGQERLDLLQASIDTIAAARVDGRLRADHHLHLRCEVPHPQVLDLFAPLAANGLLKVVSLMDHTPGQRQWRDIERYRQFHQGRPGNGEDEVEGTIRQLQADQRAHARANRQRLLEMVAGRAVALASHDDATAAHVEEAAADGMTIAEFPTTLAAAQAARRHGQAIVMGAPNVVLGRSHSGNVSAEGLARAGLLDALSSDYVPVSLLHAAFRLHGQIGIELPSALAMVTRTPAALLGLTDRGAIAPGLRADLVRVRQAGDLPCALAVWRQGQRIA
jgi:alpha-D-ribose 1-methylphosphonate 5-triphosphate diphosphatase